MAWIPNVNPNELVESQWGNTIRDHVVHTFTNAAARDSAIPAPVAGMVCWLSTPGILQVRNATGWAPVTAGIAMATNIPATDISNASTVPWGGSLDFGIAPYVRRIDSRIGLHGSSSGGATQVRISVMVNGAVERSFQGPLIPDTQSTSVALTHISTIPVNTAALIQLGVMRGSGAGSFRIVAVPELSYLEAHSSPVPSSS